MKQAYPDITLNPRDAKLVLENVCRPKEVTLKLVQSPQLWWLLAVVWQSRRCETIRDTYDLDGFTSVLCDLEARGRLTRLQRWANYMGVEQRAVGARARRQARVHDAVRQLLHDGVRTRDRIELNPELVLGDLLRTPEPHIGLGVEDNVVVLRRAFLADVKKTLRPMGPLRCWVDLRVRLAPKLVFSWRDGKGGLSFPSLRKREEWRPVEDGYLPSETLMVVFSSTSYGGLARVA